MEKVCLLLKCIVSYVTTKYLHTCGIVTLGNDNRALGAIILNKVSMGDNWHQRICFLKENNNNIRLELIRTFIKSQFGLLQLSAKILLNPYNQNIIFKLLYCHYCEFVPSFLIAGSCMTVDNRSYLNVEYHISERVCLQRLCTEELCTIFCFICFQECRL